MDDLPETAEACNLMRSWLRRTREYSDTRLTRFRTSDMQPADAVTDRDSQEGELQEENFSMTPCHVFVMFCHAELLSLWCN